MDRNESVEMKYLSGLIKFADKARDYHIRSEFMFLERKHFLSKQNGRLADAITFLIKREIELTNGSLLDYLEKNKLIDDSVINKVELLFLDLLDGDGELAPKNFDEFLIVKEKIFNHYLIKNALKVFKDFERKVRNEETDIDPSMELLKVTTTLSELHEGESESSTLYLKDPEEVDIKVISAYRYGFSKWKIELSGNLPTLKRYIEEGAIYNGSLVTISGIYKGGKTTTALGLAREFALSGAKVMYYSREMNESELSDKYVKWFFSKEEYFEKVIKKPEPAYLDKIKEELNKMDMLIERIKRPHINQITEKIKSRFLSKGLDIVFVDYLQLIRGNEKDFRLAINEITAELKGLAMDLNIVIFLLAQENIEGTVKESKSAHADSNLVLSVKLHKTENGVTFIDGNRYNFGELGRFGIIQVTCKDARNVASGWSYYTGIADGRQVEVTLEHYKEVEYVDYKKEKIF